MISSPDTIWGKEQEENVLIFIQHVFFLFFGDKEHRLGCKARGGSDARVREQMIIAKQVETSNPFCFSSTSRFFAKKGLFSILWAGPLKNDHFSSIAENGTYWPI